MNEQELNERCIQLFQNPDVRKRMWHPGMFWNVHGQDTPTTDQMREPKVDLLELEVLFAEVAHQPSLCADDLNRREPGRAEFIRRMIDRGDMPYLHRPH